MRTAKVLTLIVPMSLLSVLPSTLQSADPVSTTIRCVPYSRMGPLNSIKLGAAYLINPLAADKAKVLWKYPHEKIKDHLTKETWAKALIYMMKVPEKSKMYVFDGFQTDESNYPRQLDDLLVEAGKTEGYEVGLALPKKSALPGFEAGDGWVDWSGGATAKEISFAGVRTFTSQGTSNVFSDSREKCYEE